MTGAGLVPTIVFPLMTKPDGILAQTQRLNISFGKGQHSNLLNFLFRIKFEI